ncbi:MAG: tetratricopeptide repeat protein [Proteobacteria bacterium]|nr:tetratricopeptide repeat protein [Pseudomonadota bacterium]
MADKGPTGSREQALARMADHFRQGRLQEAESGLLEIQRLEPDFPDVPHLLALIALQTGRAGEAAGHLEKALALVPASAELRDLLGIAFCECGRFEDAEAAFGRALKIAPESPGTLGNLGNALRRLERNEEACEVLRESLRLRPGHGDTAFNLGCALNNLEDWAGAEDAFRVAVAGQPGDADAYLNLSSALLEQRKIEDGIAAAERALELDPKNAGALNNLARAAMALHRLDEAEKYARQAVEIDPEHAAAQQALCQLHFIQGRWREAWEAYWWRWRSRIGSRTRPFPQTPWAGEPLAGRKILVWGEQGVGDEILFTSMVPDLLEAGAEVMLECDERLVDLYARSFPAVRCVPRLDPPADEALDAAIDFQAPSGSLGLWLRAEEAAFPGRPSFLVADAEAAAGFRSRYAEDGGDLLVGLSWFSLRPGKSIDLDIMEPLFEVPGVRFIDLQYGDTAQERARFERRTGHRLIHDASVDPMADLDGFAAQVAFLDLVISISNTTVHMAGALGVPVWLMLSTHLIWRWGVERSDSLWYPTARLFRQAQTGDWPGLVERVRRELAARAAG